MANFNWLKQWSDNGRKMGHSVFDLSKKMCFHLPASMIVPIRFIETVPDDHFQIDMSGIMRTETMNKAAFYQGKAVFSVFFVPYKQLWHNFNQFVVVKEDKHSSTYRGSAYAPNIELSHLISFVSFLWYHQITDEFGYPAAYNAARLLQYAKICNLLPYMASDGLFAGIKADTANYSEFAAALKIPLTDAFKGRYVNLWRLLAYQHIFYDFYRNKYYDDYPYYQVNGDPQQNGLRDYIFTFNLDNLNCSDEANSHLTVDFAAPDNGNLTSAFDCRLANILNLHYCQYRKDLYTSLLPSTQFGAVSGLSFSPSFDLQGPVYLTGNTGNNLSYIVSDDLANVSTPSLEEGNLVDTDSHSITHNHSLGSAQVKPDDLEQALNTGVLPSSFDVLQLRRAELMQQWKQNALRAGNMVDDNFESHYGVKPYYEDDNNVRFLGQFECNLDVNPVTSTSATDSSVNGAVGDIAAYGIGSVAGKTLDVQIKDFGVVVICAHFQSEVYYSANGLDKQNTLIEPFDYFQSEFENAGMDSVSHWQENLGLTESLDTALGFTPPYTMHKTEVDEVFGEYGDEIYGAGDEIRKWSGSLSAWTVRRYDFSLDDGDSGDYLTEVLPLNRFYQSPRITDSIFGVEYDGKGATDPFGFAVNIGVKAIRPMSVLGIPIFG